jgi:ankyrin repeat protein
MCGRAGSGLSVLSSFLPKFVTNSIKLRDANAWSQELVPDPVVISFSFKLYDYRTCSTFTLFASLTRQLLGVDPGYFKYIRHIYELISKKDWTLENLWVLFRSTILGSAVRLTYCVIDAMNDCDPHRDHFLEDFLKLAQSPKAKLKIILTNTTGDPGRFPFDFSIDVDKRQERQKELNEYFENEILRLTRLRPGFQSISDDIRKKVLEVLAKDPNFLFISLLFKYFHDNQTRSTPAEMQNVLDNIPLKVADIYQNVFIAPSISTKKSLDWKFKALSWITYAFRPLNPEELATALAIEYPGGKFCIDRSKRPQSLKEDLKRIFGSFLDIHEDDVLLVHESARKFLFESAKDWDYAEWDQPEIYPRNEDHVVYGHARIAGICIDYLRNAAWEEVAADAGNSNLKSLPATDGSSSLFSYAARYWYVHYKLAGKLESQTLLDNARQFLEDEKRSTLWAHVEWLEGNRLATSRNTSNPLSIAAELGLNDVLLSMLDTHPEKNGNYTRVISMAAQRGDIELLKNLRIRGIVTAESDPLRLAAEKGHLKVVKYLLDSYIDVNLSILKKAKEAALHAAAQSGYELVFEELQKGEINASALVNDWTPLHRAAELGNLLICRQLLKEETNVDVNATTTDDEKSTPLHLATLSGQLSTIGFLLESAADIDSKDSKSLRPLHQAAASGLVDAVDLLLSLKAPIDSIESEGQTALHVAVEGNHTRSVQALLLGGADADVTAHSGGTPLHLIARNGNLEIAKILLEYVTKLNSLDNKGESPLHIAARYGHTSLVQLLLDSHYDIDESDESIEIFRVPLTLAAKNGGFGTVKVIIATLRNYEDVDESLYDEPLLVAAIRGNIRIVKALLQEGAGPIRDNQAFSALHSAAESGDDGVISALLDAGLYLGDDPTEGITPLHPAVESGSLKTVRLLLSANADADIPDPENGKTPLLKAAALGHTDIVNMLIDAGAELTVPEATGSSFLHCAVEGGSVEIFDLAFVNEDDILRRDKDGLIPLQIAASGGFVHAVSKLLESKESVKQVQARTMDRNRTALHLASKLGSKEIVELLLNVDDDINIVDKRDKTPLHLASKKGHTSLVEFLLQKGADPNLTNDLKRTPLFVAYESGKGNSKEIIKLLQPKTIELKATDQDDNTLLHIASRRGILPEVRNFMSLDFDIEARNSEERTPLSLAADAGHLETCKTLLAAGASFNYLDDEKETVLSRAISSENHELVILLLEKGADPELKGTRWPALYTAAYCRQVYLVREFLKRGFNKETRGGSRNWTPLHACYDSAEVTSILIEAGASTDVVDSDGQTLLDLAIDRWQPDTVEVYLKHRLDPLKPRSIDGKTPLHIAAEKGWGGQAPRSLTLLLEYSKAETFDIKDNEGHTPLQIAVVGRREGVVGALLATTKCQVNQVDSEGKTLLSLAAAKENWEIIRLLVENGAEIELAVSEDLLKAASGSGNWKMIELLLEKGPEPDEVLSKKLLKEALINTNEKVADRISEKAPHLAEALLGEATEEGDLLMIERLLSRITKLEPTIGNNILLLAARKGSDLLVNTLVEKWTASINPNIEDEHRWTPYMLAQALRHQEVKRILQAAQEDAEITVKPLEPSGLGNVRKSIPLEIREFFSILRLHPIHLLIPAFDRESLINLSLRLI